MLPHTRTYSLAIFLAATVFIFPSHETFLYDSSSNNKDVHTLAAIPGRRAHHALVYDGHQKTIMMTAGSTPLEGGRSFQFYNDLWSFDGNKWTMVGRAGDERSGIGLAFDSKRKKIYSFGGFSGNRSLDDFRVLEAGNWKTLAHLPEMTAAEPGLIYDSGRDRLVLFGGSSGRGQVNSDTWEWDGSSWKQFNGAGPGGRQAFAMVYDSKLGRTIVYGGMGLTPEKIYGDTWTFDGKTWKKFDVNGPGEGLFKKNVCPIFQSNVFCGCGKTGDHDDTDRGIVLFDIADKIHPKAIRKFIIQDDHIGLFFFQVFAGSGEVLYMIQFHFFSVE